MAAKKTKKTKRILGNQSSGFLSRKKAQKAQKKSSFNCRKKDKKDKKDFGKAKLGSLVTKRHKKEKLSYLVEPLVNFSQPEPFAGAQDRRNGVDEVDGVPACRSARLLNVVGQAFGTQAGSRRRFSSNSRKKPSTPPALSLAKGSGQGKKGQKDLWDS